jgi:diguanylate cyclase (GGDEF)-like protein/PAS domain S-box-containing protein
MGRQAAADRRLAEARARQTALAESEARYRDLVEASPEAVAVHRRGRLLYLNAAALRLLGAADAAALVGRPTSDFVHPEDRARLQAREARRAAGTVDPHNAHYRLVREDGTVVEVEAASVAMTYEGQPAVQSVFRDVTERKRLEAQLVHQALHDALTGLPNRALFRDRVAHALDLTARGYPSPGPGARPGVAVLFVDLDDFKAVNDGLGHAAGDALLVQTARRLLNATRGSDTVARLGGDEFAVLLEGLQEPAEALPVVARITDALRRPVAVEGRELAVSASVGLAHAAPGDDAESLVRHADVAMYEAKAAGKARHAVFEPAMYAAVRERFELEGALRRAAEAPAAHGFALVYQPMVELATGAPRGAEALLRWRRPGHGPVSPAEFIPAAEATGAIVPLGRWVLTEACAQLAAWHARWAADRQAGRAARADGARADDAHAPAVAVNISGRQLEAPGFVGEVAEVLRRTGAPAARVTLEITESTLMHDAEEALATLAALKALGVRLAIDDFGTGYSSLSYLQRFPVDVLKIDKSFVDRVARGGSEAALARTVVALGAMLGVRTVAEGVEDPAQREALRAIGCDDGQGYLFARPAPADEAAALLWPSAGARRAA